MIEIPTYTGPNASYCVLSWEPIAGSGEFISVGALYHHEGKSAAVPLFRIDSLRCMYGQAGDSAAEMLSSAIAQIAEVARSSGFEIARSASLIEALIVSNPRSAWAISERDLQRQIVLNHCSLSSLADTPESTATEHSTAEGDANQQWYTKVRAEIQARRPDLIRYFDREATIVDQGIPVKFGILTPSLAANFGMIRPHKLTADVDNARSKILKLKLAHQREPSLTTALICGTSRIDDITLSDKMLAKLQDNLRELDRESSNENVKFSQVYDVSGAADAAIALA